MSYQHAFNDVRDELFNRAFRYFSFFALAMGFIASLPALQSGWQPAYTIYVVMSTSIGIVRWQLHRFSSQWLASYLMFFFWLLSVGAGLDFQSGFTAMFFGVIAAVVGAPYFHVRGLIALVLLFGVTAAWIEYYHGSGPLRVAIVLIGMVFTSPMPVILSRIMRDELMAIIRKLELLNQEKSELLQRTESDGAHIRELNQRQNRLFAIIGHEIRTPIASIKMAFDQDPTMSSMDSALLCRDNIEQALAIMDDMRILTQPEQLIRAKPSRSSVENAIRHALKSLAVIAKQEDVQVSVLSCDRAKLEFVFNVALLKQACVNIIKNSLLHSKSRQLKISIDYSASDDTFSIEFRDDGVGISPSLVSQLFEPFSRGVTQTEGVGLGLFIARQIAREHFAGDLNFSNAPQGGAIFTLRLHIQPVTDDGVNNRQIPHDYSGRRVLLVEDNPSLLKMTESLLNRLGVDVVTARNGHEAKLAFADHQGRFDVVITDIKMPTVDGFELVSWLRKESYDGMVVGLTAASVGDSMKRLFHLGADEVLVKPVDINDLNRLFSGLDSRAPVQIPTTKIDNSRLEINVEAAIARLGGSEVMYFSVLKDVLPRLDDTIRAIRLALETRDATLLREKLHYLVGTISAVGSENFLYWMKDIQAELRHRPEQVDFKTLAFDFDARYEAFHNALQAIAMQKKNPTR